MSLFDESIKHVQIELPYWLQDHYINEKTGINLNSINAKPNNQDNISIDTSCFTTTETNSDDNSDNDNHNNNNIHQIKNVDEIETFDTNSTLSDSCNENSTHSTGTTNTDQLSFDNEHIMDQLHETLSKQWHQVKDAIDHSTNKL